MRSDAFSSFFYIDGTFSWLSNRYSSKKKAFTKASKKWADDLGKKTIEDNFKKMIRYCKYIRIIVHSQVSKYIYLMKFLRDIT